MIVKNESPVIERCLASVKPWIDHWVIVDTGSTDGTQERIRTFMKDVPGELHERPWRDFAFNRNQALDLARAHGDHILFIDADETLAVPENFAWPALPADGYQLRCDSNGWNYFRNSIVATRLPWRWEGVLHEYLTCDQPHAWDSLQAPSIQVSHDGARARSGDTYLRDIEVLEHALRDAQRPARSPCMKKEIVMVPIARVFVPSRTLLVQNGFRLVTHIAPTWLSRTRRAKPLSSILVSCLNPKVPDRTTNSSICVPHCGLAN